MDEMVFYIRKQEDGWYLASTRSSLKKGGCSTEAPDFETLKEKIKEAAKFHLGDGYHKELDLSKNPQIRLVYFEALFHNPQAERILITGIPGQEGYRVRNGLLSLDLHHRDLKALREELVKKVQEQGHQDKHVEFRLEEVLQLTPDSSGD